MGNNRVALIEFPQTKETISKWHHESDIRDAVCVMDLVNFRTSAGMIKADPVYCENVTLKYVCGIVYMDELGNIEQSQFPALGLTHWEEGCGVCLDLTGFCLYGEDVGYLDDIHAEIDKCDPCAVYQALCDCKLNLALNKDDKAGISFMDTSVTFRKTDTQLLLDLEAEYREKCMKKCNPSHNSRRFRQPMRCR